jgi:VanZ family protein
VAPERLTAKLLGLAFWIPLAVCTYLAFDPSPPQSVFRISEVVLHGFAFTYLTLALELAHRQRHWLAAALWMLGYGLFIETVQAFEPQRAAEFKDLLVDTAGIGAGLLLSRWFGTRVRLVTHRLVGMVTTS